MTIHLYIHVCENLLFGVGVYLTIGPDGPEQIEKVLHHQVNRVCAHSLLSLYLHLYFDQTTGKMEDADTKVIVSVPYH